MAISNYPKGFRQGFKLKEVPFFDRIAGNVFWVDSATGTAGNSGSHKHPVASLQAGVDLCTADNGDYVFVRPGHAEAITAQIDLDTAGVTVVGLGNGNNRPTLTPNGTIDCIDVSAANCTLANFIFGVPGTNAQTSDVNVDAASFTLYKTRHLGSTGSNAKLSFVTVTTSGEDLLIDGMRAYNDTVDMASAISLEAVCERVEIRNCLLLSSGAKGYSVGVIDDGAALTELYIHDCLLSQQVSTELPTLTFASNSVGMCVNLACDGRDDTTIQDTVLPGTGMDFFEVFGIGKLGLSAIRTPALDAE